MRSRYSAFALGNPDYLLATWHPTVRPEFFSIDSNEEWLGLKITGSSTAGDTATVSFVARSRQDGTTHVLTETSRFGLEEGRWYYLGACRAKGARRG